MRQRFLGRVIGLKLRIRQAKSSLHALTLLAITVLWSSAMSTGLQAHEVLPSVGRLSVAGQEVTLELRINAEAFVAGIDLDGLEDTNASPESQSYDTLRALAPSALASRIRENWARIGAGLEIESRGTPVPLQLGDVDVSEIGDVEVARPSRIILTGTLPDNAETLRLTWPAGHGTIALRFESSEDGYADYLNGGETSPPIALNGKQGMTALRAFINYVPVGFDHILPKGLDHILFVLGLFFLSPAIRPLLWQVSAFTVAHTVTLALGALGWVNVPGSIVEPLIALSIAYVAVENIFSSKLHRWRPVVVFLFGLLHGLGFASVLQEFGLPQSQLIPALLGFNVGVELGQLTVIAAAFLLVGAWFREKGWYRPAIAIPCSTVIACIGLYWAVERTFL
ncbi:HupE/UreJ family protein [Pseudooceanicola sp. C21-150M6]|uniref:HupE/UreJ family protein n=1 Tax=Pseudooceanicola sp. C21-150M6 TaxID=3434355 RepID=UPI003D7F800F